MKSSQGHIVLKNFSIIAIINYSPIYSGKCHTQGAYIHRDRMCHLCVQQPQRTRLECNGIVLPYSTRRQHHKNQTNQQTTTQNMSPSSVSLSPHLRRLTRWLLSTWNVQVNQMALVHMGSVVDQGDNCRMFMLCQSRHISSSHLTSSDTFSSFIPMHPKIPSRHNADNNSKSKISSVAQAISVSSYKIKKIHRTHKVRIRDIAKTDCLKQNGKPAQTILNPTTPCPEPECQFKKYSILTLLAQKVFIFSKDFCLMICNFPIQFAIYAFNTIPSRNQLFCQFLLPVQFLSINFYVLMWPGSPSGWFI